MNEPKRYDFTIYHEDYDCPVVKRVESELGQFVTYSAYEELLKQFDKLEEVGVGYWLGDEFYLVEKSNL